MFTPSERATILACLRYTQADLDLPASLPLNEIYPDHFADIDGNPIAPADIDDLCDRINQEPIPTAHSGPRYIVRRGREEFSGFDDPASAQAQADEIGGVVIDITTGQPIEPRPADIA